MENKYSGMLAWEETILYLCTLEMQRYPMAQHDNAFSLADIRKKADKIQIFDERTLDEEGKTIPFVDQMALVTH